MCWKWHVQEVDLSTYMTVDSAINIFDNYEVSEFPFENLL